MRFSQRFVRSGYIKLVIDTTGGFGNFGLGWSRTSGIKDTIGYHLRFYEKDTGPSDGIARWYGFPLRCLAL